MLDIDSIYDPVTDAVPPMDAQELYDALMSQGAPAWLADAVVETVTNVTGNSVYLSLQVNRHVPGWVRS